jgi:hypothetical protein
MKKIIILVVAFLLHESLFAQNIGSILNQANAYAKKHGIKVPNLPSGGTAAGAKPLSNEEIVKGLKEALTQGTSKSTEQVSKVDGFLKDAAIKVLIPPDARKAEVKLRELGLGSLADKVIVSINRASEDAAIKAKPIFINAITSMSIQDAMGILKGPNTAATDYLKRTTTNQLTAAFQPSIKQSLDKVNATKYWADFMNTYNRLPLVQKINPDLASFVTQKAMEGIFLKISEEEKNIRQNPIARTTDILKRVFGYIFK